MILPLLLAANPLFTDTFTADPAPIVVYDTCYVITTEDENDDTPGQWLIMNHWRAYSSKNMKDWTYHGRIMDWSTYSWGKSDSWASQVVKGADGKFYHYTTLVGRFDQGYGCRCLGVCVSDTPVGPWKDAIGKPLIKDSDTPSPYGWDDIDPTVLIDDDGTPWLVWGNPVCYAAKLKRNMIEFDGEIKTLPLPNYTEGPWLFKRNGIYYLAYVSHNHLGYWEKVAYATAPSMEGPWTYRGLLCENPGDGFGIHPGICEFKGQWYFFYFNAGLQIPGGLHGNSNRRSVCADYMYFNPDGSIRPIVMTKEGLEAPPLPQRVIDAEFKPVAPEFSHGLKPGLTFIGPDRTANFRTFEALRHLDWSPENLRLATGRNLYYDFPNYSTHRRGWGGAETLAQTFRPEKDIRADRFSIFVGNGDGTDAQTKLAARLYNLGSEQCPRAASYEPRGEDLLSGRGEIAYVPGFRAPATFVLASGNEIVLRTGHTYVFELVATRGTSPIVWFSSAKDIIREGSAYRDGQRLMTGKDNQESVDFGLAVYGREL